VGYEGASLVDMIDQLDDASQRTGRRLAESFQERGLHNIERNTPVETFHLRNSYKRSPISYKQLSTAGYTSIRWSAYAWEGSVFTEVEYAPYVELGTGLWGPKRQKYKIQPKKPGGVLAFTPYSRMPNGGVILDVQGNITKSGPVVVRFVMHPGSPGHHMFRIGAILTEHEIREWSREPLRLWKTEVESRVRTGALAL
jgi:hypothetical protein